MKVFKRVLVAAIAAASVLFATGCQPDAVAPEITVDPVTFTSEAGNSLKPGSTIHVETKTENAVIYYTFDTEITKSNIEDLINDDVARDSDGDIVITKSCTVYAIAKLNTSYSDVTSETYEVLPVPEVTMDVDAGVVVKGSYVKITAATAGVEDDEITIYYSTETVLDDDNYKTEGTVYDTATAETGILINKKTVLSAIAEGTNGTSEVVTKTYNIPLLKLSTLTDGDVVCVAYTDSSKKTFFMKDSENSSKMAYTSGITIAADAVGVSAPQGTGFYTVKKNEAGQVMLINGGKYLTSGATGNSLTLSDTFSVYALWDNIEESASGAGTYYLKNSNAFYNGTAQALEYYSGFTSYNFSATNSVFNFEFYKDEDMTPENVDVSASNVLATPAFDKENEAEVFQYGVVSLSSISRGAKFYYSYSEELTKENYKTAGTEAVDGEFNLAGEIGSNVTVHAIAVLQDKLFSESVTRTFKVTEYTGTVLTSVSTIADGDVVVIYYPDAKVALSSTPYINSKSNAQTGLSGTNAILLSKGMVYSSSLTFFTVKAVSGGYVLINNGKYLTSGATGSNLLMEDEYSKYAVWDIEESTTEGALYIKNMYASNSSKAQYFEYFDRFTTYSLAASKVYDFNIFKIAADNTENVTAETLEVPGVFPVEYSTSGTVTKDTVVTLSTATEGATIKYQFIESTDKTTTPISTSDYATAADYADGVTISKSGTLYAIAMIDGKTSNVTSCAYETINGVIINISTKEAEYTFGDLSVKFGSAIAYVNPVRFYKNNTMTLESSNKNIEEIVFTFNGSYTGGSLTADSGFTSSDKGTTWTGDSKKVVFTAGEQTRFDSVLVLFKD